MSAHPYGGFSSKRDRGGSGNHPFHALIRHVSHIQNGLRRLMDHLIRRAVVLLDDRGAQNRMEVQEPADRRIQDGRIQTTSETIGHRDVVRVAARM